MSATVGSTLIVITFAFGNLLPKRKIRPAGIIGVGETRPFQDRPRKLRGRHMGLLGQTLINSGIQWAAGRCGRRSGSSNRNGANVIQANMEKLFSFCRAFGLHPLTALGLFAVDWMLFGEEVATAGAGWLISLPVGVVLGLIAILIQKHAYKDETMPAVAKGLLVGLLTAIPAPLSSFGILPLAAFGLVRVLFSKQRQLTEGEPSPYRFNSELAHPGGQLTDGSGYRFTAELAQPPEAK